MGLLGKYHSKELVYYQAGLCPSLVNRTFALPGRNIAVFKLKSVCLVVFIFSTKQNVSFPATPYDKTKITHFLRKAGDFCLITIFRKKVQIFDYALIVKQSYAHLSNAHFLPNIFQTCG
ncbi:MAG: hypothetical protein A3C50_03005 [Candidatus Staskawiczbacteria bacterium RIFCSPHIGHO2_02_FULL_43_16]|uniref:Uncharacterized protein n=1 Tax=Candidatus Staskawiczbacteria bacterium RIFCSPHIGHO2_01_FULL_41_41 TaxID=1802203 RepID=A0A1G2HRL1_9BACT|nr:MAG: hypothetical protein A2822_01090 [Candidatus Staskawiczbacteria bacterium RIFCSPHIGHO2_01_FULL_41_41]OGZ68584.1 MAG: hypothetical protein A3C50_03005 [Candidatus Staskawiczbacteria bacterium RIFCSPHIGHO2_02_FULL_43_16]